MSSRLSPARAYRRARRCISKTIHPQLPSTITISLDAPSKALAHAAAIGARAHLRL